MIPSYLIQIENFPLTVNGKIDTKLLPKPKLIKKNEYIAPRNELEKTFAEILSSLLQIDKISIDDNFFDIGCDSLIAIRFQIEALKKNLDINYNNIFAYPTIRLLSEKKSNDLIYNIDKNYNYDKINLLVNKNKTYTPKKALKFKNNKLLLFGSTGFLGAHILDEYLSSNPNNIVYCIIRKKSLVSSTERFRKKLNFYFNNKYDSEFGNRIFVIEGDIAKEKLGIPDKTLSEVFDTIDIVINSAAIVKHYGDSNLFNSINVKGTQNIVNICKKFNKKLYHISTLSVSGSGIDSGEENRIIYDEGSFYVGQNLNNIYTLTKFNAEKIILEEINNGLNATILRIGNITNRFSDGKFQINISENAFINKIKSILNLGVIQNRFLEHAIEFTPVDYCAKSIISIINTNNDYSILHLFNVNTIEFTDLINYINKLGYKLKPVTNDVFSQTVTTFLNNDKLKDKISGIATDLTKNKLLNYFSQNLINADITNNFLNEIGFSWPILDFEYFKKYFEYFKNINFFE